MHICHTCGVIVKGTGNRCYACGNLVTVSSTSRLGFQKLDQPLKLATQATVKEFERFVSQRIPSLSTTSQAESSANRAEKLKVAVSEQVESELRHLKDDLEARVKAEVNDFWATAKTIEEQAKQQAKAQARSIIEEATPPAARLVVSDALDSLGLTKTADKNNAGVGSSPAYTGWNDDLEGQLFEEQLFGKNRKSAQAHGHTCEQERDRGQQQQEFQQETEQETEQDLDNEAPIKWSTRQKSKSRDSFFDAEADEFSRRTGKNEATRKARTRQSTTTSEDHKDFEIKVRIPKVLFKKRTITIAALLMSCVAAASQQLSQQTFGSGDVLAIATKWYTDHLAGVAAIPGAIKAPTTLPVLSGKWQITTTANNQEVQGNVTIDQSGDLLSGIGHDKVGDFRVNGKIETSGIVQFQKDYFAKGLVPIKYKGTVKSTESGLIMDGSISAKVARGGLINRPVASISGEWKAHRIDNSIVRSLPNGLEKLYTLGATILGAISLGAVFLTYYLFNPNGKINVWEKEKYIPSQFRGKHAKAVREFAKPLRAGGVPLGRRCEWKPIFVASPRDLAIPPAMRESNPHILIVGTANKGKSRLMASMVAHDIQSRDRSVVVIDTKGVLTDLTLRWIAAHRQGKQLAQRVILIDPTVKGGVVTYNPLQVCEGDNLHTASASIVQGFKAMYTEGPGAQAQQWSQQTANILRNAALLLMINDRTLLDLARLLQDNDFRDVLLDKVLRERDTHPEHESLIEAWDQYKKLARTESWITWVEPILNRIGQPLSDPRIRPILAQSENQLDLARVISEKKVLLVRIPQGQLDQNANLLGSLLVTGLRRAAGDIRESRMEVEPTALYLDEFDQLIEKDTLTNLTSEASQTKIGFIGATQTLQQFPEEVRNQLNIKIGTTIAFAVTKKDADMLGPQLFRVDGRKHKNKNFTNFINPINSTPQFELVTDEQHLNVDRMVGLEAKHFFCYREGLTAGVFKLKAHDFTIPTEQQINRKLIEKMRRNNA